MNLENNIIGFCFKNKKPKNIFNPPVLYRQVAWDPIGIINSKSEHNAYIDKLQKEFVDCYTNKFTIIQMLFSLEFDKKSLISILPKNIIVEICKFL